MAVFHHAVVAATLIAVATGAAFAQTYPNRPVKIVVPFPAGGGTDALTRFVAKGMEQRLGQPFIIENRGGAGTTLGAAAVARSDPDGYTILVGTASTFAAAPGLYKRLAYDPNKDFAPVMLFATVPFVLVVHPSLGVSTVQELIALAKSKPGELSLCIRRRRRGSPHLLRAVHVDDRHRHEARAVSRRRPGAQRRGGRPRAGLFRRRRAGSGR